MRTFLAALCVISAACAGSIIELPPTTPALLRGGTTPYALRALTDMETVNDVAAFAGQTYVATSDGLWWHGADTEPRRIPWTAQKNVTGVAVRDGEGVCGERRHGAIARGRRAERAGHRPGVCLACE